MTRLARLRRTAGVAIAAVSLAVASGGWLAAFAGLGGSTAAADPINACTPTSGTIVAVDFGHWGGPVVRGCGVGDASAYDLLHDGGFSTTGTAHDGPGFVCRIGSGAFQGGAQYPTPLQDACVNTPPASAYWTFWVAEPGQSRWTYSRVGAVSYQPNAGEVQVWRFGATPTGGGSGAPPYSPATLRAAARASTTAAPPPHASSPASTRAATPAQQPPPSSVDAGAGQSSGSVQPTQTASASHSIAAPRPTSATTRRIDPVVVAASPAATHPPAGSAMPALLGASAVAVLTAGAGGLAWRRRGQRR